MNNKLTDEVEHLIDAVGYWQQDYDPKEDSEQYEFFGRIATALRELQERRQTDKPPVHPTVASEQLDDETLQEMIEFRRSTFEYHSKEGNKVQTIIHGVTLSALRELQERRKAAEPELKPANLVNKFYERYPLASFSDDNFRAAALGYFMAGAELQCFGEFVKYEDLCFDE